MPLNLHKTPQMAQSTSSMGRQIQESPETGGNFTQIYALISNCFLNCYASRVLPYKTKNTWHIFLVCAMARWITKGQQDGSTMTNTRQCIYKIIIIEAWWQPQLLTLLGKISSGTMLLSLLLTAVIWRSFL